MQQRTVPQNLYDIYLPWGSDLALSFTGDLLTTFGTQLSEQLVIRRLLTATASYIWSPTYGAGIPAFVGQALSTDLYEQIKSVVRANIFLEASVSQVPPPEILLQIIQGGIFGQINYTVAPLQQPIVLTFNTEGL